MVVSLSCSPNKSLPNETNTCMFSYPQHIELQIRNIALSHKGNREIVFLPKAFFQAPHPFLTLQNTKINIVFA